MKKLLFTILLLALALPVFATPVSWDYSTGTNTLSPLQSIQNSLVKLLGNFQVLGTSTLTNASTTNLTVGTALSLTGLTNSYLSVNGSGQIIATTTPLLSFTESDPLYAVASSSILRFGTSSDALTEGLTNKFYADSKVASYISSSSTLNTTFSNANTAYGWGNHASAGYLTSTLAASTYLTLSASTSLAYLKVGTTSVSSITNLPNLSITKAQVSNFGYYPATTTSNTWAGTQTFSTTSSATTSATYISAGIPSILAATGVVMEGWGNDNTTNGVQIGVGNRNAGSSAYSGVFLNNNLADNTVVHYGFLGLNSSNYSDTSFGTSQGIPNMLTLQDTDGPILILASTSTAPAYISFLTGGSNTGNERMRIISTGNVGIGTTTPTSRLSIVGTTTQNSPLFSVASSSGTTLFSIGVNGHMLTGGAVPTISSCGVSPTIKGDDGTMRATIGTGASLTTCLITFAKTWKNTSNVNISPVCIAEQEVGTPSLAISASSTPTTVTLTTVVAGFGGQQIDVSCKASNNFIN